MACVSLFLPKPLKVVQPAMCSPEETDPFPRIPSTFGTFSLHSCDSVSLFPEHIPFPSMKNTLELPWPHPQHDSAVQCPFPSPNRCCSASAEVQILSVPEAPGLKAILSGKMGLIGGRGAQGLAGGDTGTPPLVQHMLLPVHYHLASLWSQEQRSQFITEQNY